MGTNIVNTNTISSNKYNGIDYPYPVPKTSIDHVLTLSGSTTDITINGSNILRKACKDNTGAANFKVSGDTNPAVSFYDDTGTNYIFPTVCEDQLKALNLPLSRIYYLYYSPGGLEHSLDLLADICNRNNIAQEKTIVCIDHFEASMILDPSVYTQAVKYIKNKNYKFRYWEIQNEPAYAHILTDAIDYGNYVLRCSTAIKGVDPGAIVGCQMLRNSVWSRQLVDTVGEKVDFIAGHWYGGLCDIADYETSEVILADNFKAISYISTMNTYILNQVGKRIPQIDTEWRLLADNGSDDGEWGNHIGNIIGTLYQAVRLIYNIRDGYIKGSCCWHAMGGQPGILVPSGWGTHLGNVDFNGKTSYLYWLYYHFINSTGDNIVSFTGSAPSFTGTAPPNAEDGSSVQTEHTGPLTPVLVTKSNDNTKLYITVVNGSTANAVNFSAIINNFTINSITSYRISDTDLTQNFYQDDTSRFLSTPIITNTNGTLTCTLPILSCTFIIIQ